LNFVQKFWSWFGLSNGDKKDPIGSKTAAMTNQSLVLFYYSFLVVAKIYVRHIMTTLDQLLWIIVLQPVGGHKRKVLKIYFTVILYIAGNDCFTNRFTKIRFARLACATLK